eukprot:TRINITY_DN12243_c0_g1_i1.p1 TRINITY_DN12243_c0_g1~~TRINITY_DN12243_c0_g1_i1.p1  ORF type:complete len:475 (-),score=50.59 TRINITY_DN12243_c0_g1_i1:21-1322(-)
MSDQGRSSGTRPKSVSFGDVSGKAICSSRKNISLFLEGANKNTLFSASWWYWRANLVITCLSCLIYALESNPAYVKRPLAPELQQQVSALLAIQIILTLPQTIDFMMRVIFATSPLRYLIRPLRIMELLFFIFFYIHIGLVFATSSTNDIGSDQFWALHILAGLRLIGVTRLFRYFKGIRIIFGALRRKWFAFMLFIGVATICAFTFSAALFYVEKSGEFYDSSTKLWIRNVDKTVSPFQSIYSTMWWGVATITTVGYGDHYPVTDAGKVIGAAACIIGVMMVSMPIGIFASAFGEIWAEYEKHKRKQWREGLTSWRQKTLDDTNHIPLERQSFNVDAFSDQVEEKALRSSSSSIAQSSGAVSGAVRRSVAFRTKRVDSPIVDEIRKQQQILLDLMQKFNDQVDGYDEDAALDPDSDLDEDEQTSDSAASNMV